jgi:hypothetical protein
MSICVAFATSGFIFVQSYYSKCVNDEQQGHLSLFNQVTSSIYDKPLKND